MQSIQDRYLLSRKSCSPKIHTGNICNRSPQILPAADGMHNQKYHGFEFMHDLVSDMTHRDPAKRPLIEEVVDRFAHIRESLSRVKLRSPMTSKKQPSLFTAFRYARQAIRSFYYVVSSRSAIPQL